MKSFNVGDLVKLSPFFYRLYSVDLGETAEIFIIIKKHQEMSGIICGKKCKQFKCFTYDIQCLKDNFIMTRMKKNELTKI